MGPLNSMKRKAVFFMEASSTRGLLFRAAKTSEHVALKSGVTAKKLRSNDYTNGHLIDSLFSYNKMTLAKNISTLEAEDHKQVLHF